MHVTQEPSDKLAVGRATRHEVSNRGSAAYLEIRLNRKVNIVAVRERGERHGSGTYIIYIRSQVRYHR